MVSTALSIDMDSTESFNYSPLSPTSAVKVESFESGHSLLRSPPSSRSPSRVKLSSASSSRFRRKSSHLSSRGELSIMTHPYGNWQPATLKNEQSSGHRGYSGVAPSSGAPPRSGSGDQQSFFNPDHYSQPVSSDIISSQLRLIYR
jgi:hypothetical protein